MKTVIVSLEGGESITLKCKDPELQDILKDIRTDGISASDKDFTYLHLPHKIKVIRISREES